MKPSFPIANRIYLKLSSFLVFFVVLVLVFSELFLPTRGWAQSAQTGVFYFTGPQQFLRRSERLSTFLPGEGLTVGRVKLHPFFGVAQSWTDNVFRTDKNRRTDYGTALAPGIQAYLPFGGRHSFLLDYRAAQTLYKNFDENNAFAQHGTGHLRFDFPGGLSFDLQGGRIDGFDPRGSELDIQERDITKWRINSLQGKVGFSGKKGRIRLTTRFQDLHFKNNGQDTIRDRYRLSSSLSTFLKATPTISGILGVRIINNTFDDNKQLDSFGYGVYSGFDLAPSRLLSGEFNIGYTVLNFDRAPVERPPGSELSSGGKQQERLTMRGRFLWRPTSRFTLNLRVFRFIRQSAAFDTSTFIQTGGRVTVRQKLSDRLGMRGQFGYRNADFEGGRTDNRIRANFGLDYRTVNWLGFRLDYVYGQRFSTDKDFEFYSNTIFLSAQVFL